MDRPTATAVLKRNYLFRGLPERIIDRLASVGNRRVYRKGELIFAQGDPGDALFAVISGRARISAMGADGREVFLNIMESGDTFGEIAVVDGLSRTAGATAIAPTVLMAIRRNELLDLLEDEPQLAIHLLKLFCERVRWTSELYEESAFLTAPARLAKRLVSLAKLHGSGKLDTLELRISQGELAQFLGVSRQIVNQHLQDWRREGWVDISRARLVVRDIGALSKLALDDVLDAAVPDPEGLGSGPLI
jgi:CRP-like cAMP-binding protein